MPYRIAVFPSKLGWMAIVGSEEGVVSLTFGHRSAQAAIKAIPAHLRENAEIGHWKAPIVGRLQAYAAGKFVDFSDVQVDSRSWTQFQRQVLERCRAIPYGATTTYSLLARAAGSSRAARAVGNCMAGNRVPLVIPCHRVTPTGKGLGGYSGAQGVETKRHLIAMEAQALARRRSAPRRASGDRLVRS